MKRVILMAMMLVWSTYLLSQTGGYAIGETVDPSDNISWTIQGPDGHPDVGLSDNMFDMIRKGKPVMIFFGEDW